MPKRSKTILRQKNFLKIRCKKKQELIKRD